MIRTFLLLIYLFNAVAGRTQTIKTENILYNGNIITNLLQYDTTEIEDPKTGQLIKVVTVREKLDRLNGKTIYFDKPASDPVGAARQTDIYSFLRELFQDDLKNAPKMHLELVIDEQGKLAYFEVQEPSCREMAAEAIPAEARQIEKKLSAMQFVPAYYDGTPVPFRIYFDNIE